MTKFNPAGIRALKIDRVILSLLAAVALLALIDRSQVPVSIAFTLQSLIELAPFMLLAILFAAYISATGADQFIAKAFSGKAYKAIISAALIGAVSPFCSCGVIPLIAAMLASGVPLAPVMAFWIASPIMDPEMFILTSAGVGLPFALFKASAAFSMGLMAGSSVLLLQKFNWLASETVLKGSGCSSGCRTPIDDTEQASYYWAFWRSATRKRMFVKEVQSIGWFLLKWLALAFFLESLMVRYIPADAIVGILGRENRLAIPIAALVGIPSYLNGYAAIPLISGLLDMGIAKGAAMTFVTSGAVTSMPAAIAVYALVRKPVFFAYIALGLMGSMLVGFAYQISGLPVS